MYVCVYINRKNTPKGREKLNIQFGDHHVKKVENDWFSRELRINNNMFTKH